MGAHFLGYIGKSNRSNFVHYRLHHKWGVQQSSLERQHAATNDFAGADRSTLKVSKQGPEDSHGHGDSLWYG